MSHKMTAENDRYGLLKNSKCLVGEDWCLILEITASNVQKTAALPAEARKEDKMISLTELSDIHSSSFNRQC